MNNPLTYRVESSLGAVFVSLLALFFIGVLFIAVKNFNTDIDIMTVEYASARTVRKISQSELLVIREWIKVNDIEIPEGRGYNYLLRKYPDRPWFD